MPLALYALTAGAFGIGVTEFVIMGLLIEVGGDLGVSIPAAGLLISGYALGVVVGAPIMTIATAKWPRKTVLLVLMGIFTLGNLACALAPDYWSLMAARVLTALAHGTFFGVGSVVATGLVPENKKASAISIMFAGLTVATILGVPFGTWLGQAFGWRATFLAVTLVGLGALAAVALLVPPVKAPKDHSRLSDDLAVLRRPQVLLALLTTILGWIGIFALFTYVAPILTKISGFSDAAVSPILLVFGGGAIVGNLLGGRFADSWPAGSVFGSLLVLAIVLALLSFAAHSQTAIVVGIALFGAAAFATAAPLQMAVLRRAEGAGQSLASSFNIAAFNLGNAIGAWLGGAVIAHGGLNAVAWVAALAPLAGVGVASLAMRAGRTQARVAAAAE
ncbi:MULTISPECIES: MFS transporter [Rhodopseudomonas]|uniref:Arabinose transporter permease n=1 Tax=Rhodopseudomonas palustris TaxID=1076 RepID=A0A0D7EE46_RHOPL|nr:MULTISPECIES: MFS transporter [Rhodopseudomonas]KIZ38906.1 arabinose transporter permease [Rhodopseudomonas palustris]MDF3810231.1 MFS transporter [Rhodopseudomonas sp. BAL398]WOK18316.1 MFS transporter [Rhodopseudomonas sp. BAL398]